MKIAVVKLSGKAIKDFISNPDCLKVIKKLHASYDGLIIVHGAGNQISEWTTALGGKNNFIDGQRVTDEFSMNVVAAVQAGMINSRITSFLCSRDLNAIGLTGIDNNIFVASLNAETVFFVSDVKGVLLNGKIKKEICQDEITEGINNKQITGGMIPKLQSCASLINAGVKRVWIGNNLSGLLSGRSNGIANGTWIVPVYSGIAEAV